MSEELVNEWVTKAEEDYRTLEELYNKSPSDFANTICFHAQQCAEKYLKALLTKHGIDPPWIHTLETLLDLIILKIPELEKYRVTLAELTPYATEYRYPGTVANQEDAKICVSIIRKLRNDMRAVLNVMRDTNS
jgi:HEPN domain-containing protein